MKKPKPLVLKMRGEIYSRWLGVQKSLNTSRVGFWVKSIRPGSANEETVFVWMNKKQVESIKKWLDNNS